MRIYSKLSEEHKNKISLSLKGREFSKELRKKISLGVRKNKKNFWKVNKHRFYEIKICKQCNTNFNERIKSKRKFCCREYMLVYQRLHSKSRRVKMYPRQFDSNLKESIRLRDNYKCRNCGCSQLENGSMLDVHHIDYDKNNCLYNNLLSLCDSCHPKTNGNREYWKKYFTEMMSEAHIN